MSSRYNPIRETFQSGDIVTVNPLSGGATPPADLDIAAHATFNTQPVLVPNLVTNKQAYLFDIRDIPHIVGLGFFGNLADCIVDVTLNASLTANPGLYLQFQLDVCDIHGTVVQTLSSHFNAALFRVFNTIFDYDLYLASLVKLIAPANYLPGVNFLKLSTIAETGSCVFATKGLNPAFASYPFLMWSEVVIEHTFPTVAAT